MSKDIENARLALLRLDAGSLRFLLGQLQRELGVDLTPDVRLERGLGEEGGTPDILEFHVPDGFMGNPSFEVVLLDPGPQRLAVAKHICSYPGWSSAKVLACFQSLPAVLGTFRHVPRGSVGDGTWRAKDLTRVLRDLGATVCVRLVGDSRK